MPNLPSKATKTLHLTLQVPAGPTIQAPESDTLNGWAEAYFRFQVTTSDRSQREQRRNLQVFLSFLKMEVRELRLPRWTPRVSREFIDHLRNYARDSGQRRYSDRTINRMLARSS